MKLSARKTLCAADRTCFGGINVKREKFASRLGFLLISAGCAIGIGNVWRFPYITGAYGGEMCIRDSFMPDVRIVCAYGGANINKQIEQLKKGPQIVVATPGRLQDHINRRTVDVSHVRDIVLDEADEMLNMGFYKDVRKILDTIKSKQRLAMFSATISREVMDIGWLYQREDVYKRQHQNGVGILLLNLQILLHHRR